MGKAEEMEHRYADHLEKETAPEASVDLEISPEPANIRVTENEMEYDYGGF